LEAVEPCATNGDICANAASDDKRGSDANATSDGTSGSDGTDGNGGIATDRDKL
jgi:hypothetical protein